MIELRPRLENRVWGGERLARMYGLSRRRPLGEAWLVYDGNEIASGRYAGMTLRDAAPLLGERFFGRGLHKKHAGLYPLMIKLIDTADWLSVQVHPDDGYAASREAASGYTGKDEAWLVLQAEPGARIVYGFSARTSPAEVRRAVNEGRLHELLNFVEVSAGDFIYLPAGTVHALGPGLLVAEVSQRSDLTYRLFDYGRGRQLHIDRALEVACFDEARPQIEKAGPGFSFTGRRFEVVVFAGEARAGALAAAVAKLEEAGNGMLLAADGIFDGCGKRHLLSRPVV